MTEAGFIFRKPAGAQENGEEAIVSVIQDEYVHGVSKRKVDELVRVRAMGLDGVDESALSRLCSNSDEDC